MVPQPEKQWQQWQHKVQGLAQLQTDSCQPLLGSLSPTEVHRKAVHACTQNQLEPQMVKSWTKSRLVYTIWHSLEVLRSPTLLPV